MGTEYGIFGDYLFRTVSRNISRMASKFQSVMTQDDVMDLIQDTWLRIVDKSDQYDPDGNFEGWMYRICQNESVAHIENSIDTLKPKQQKLVWMLVDEVPYKRMAPQLGCRVETVKTQVCRVRQCLRKAM